MGLLAPLYALAALAIAGPIILHLIRRQPKGQLQFSSLMFLQPSPPRLTRRSRLDNLFLLLLRSLAFCLIALAFARLFVRNVDLAREDLVGRTVAILLDTSGSMQRKDVWEKAKQHVVDFVDSLSPADRVGLYTIDQDFKTLVPLDAANNSVRLDNPAQQQAVRDAVKSLTPTWHTTKLALHLMAAADMLQAKTIVEGKAGATNASIVLVSDLHESSGLESLQGFPWPKNVRLDVRRASPKKPGNTRLSIMENSDGEEEEVNVVRVRVENNSDSTESSFRLAWQGNSGALATVSETSLQVPPGQVRVIPMPNRPSGADRIVLTGDLQDFDNTAYIPHVEPVVEQLAYVGPPADRPEKDPYYFLSRAPLSTQYRKIEIARVEATKLEGLLADPALGSVVVDSALPVSTLESLTKFCQLGKVVIYCASHPAGIRPDYAQALRILTGSEGLAVAEAETKDFSLFGVIDFQSKLFSPFADVRFSDFSKIRIWTHRNLDLPDSDSWQVLARFDDGNPALIHRSVGKGDLWILATGWQADTSQLGLSSKFVPLLAGMIDPANKARFVKSIYEVGQPILIAELEDLKVTKTDGSITESDIQGDNLTFDTPDLYQLTSERLRRQVAVQVPESESQLMEMGLERFEQYGVQLGKLDSDSQRREAARQLQNAELESRQKIWQWLLLAGVLMLVLETGVAGWLARRPVVATA